MFGQLLQDFAVAVGHVADVAQPVVGQPDAGALEGGADTGAALPVAATTVVTDISAPMDPRLFRALAQAGAFILALVVLCGFAAAAGASPFNAASTASTSSGSRCSRASKLVTTRELLRSWLVVLLADFFSDTPASEVAASMLEPLDALDLIRNLSPTRRNGLAAARALVAGGAQVAAAGGVGLLAVQLAKLMGLRVIGTVSTEDKAALARAASPSLPAGARAASLCVTLDD